MRTSGLLKAVQGIFWTKISAASSARSASDSGGSKRGSVSILSYVPSIRKTVTTQLENAGVPENVTADLLGHQKSRITYGVYSGDTSLAVKARALAKLR